MTDLAKLASEITPGPWVFRKHLVNEVECYGIKANGHSVLWRPRYHKADHANATAMALVHELIAEVLQLRGTVEQVRDAIKDLRSRNAPDVEYLPPASNVWDLNRASYTVDKIDDIVNPATESTQV